MKWQSVRYVYGKVPANAHPYDAKSFKFWKAYSGKNYSGQLKSFSTREHFILNALAPSLKLDYEAEEVTLFPYTTLFRSGGRD